MNETQIAQLEARLETAVEGVFAYFFGRRIHARDIALHLARAMENNLEAARDSDPRPVAPDQYTIHVSQDVQRRIYERYPGLAQALGDLLVDMATDAGYRMKSVPGIEIVSDAALGNAQLAVSAFHVRTRESTTVAMKRIQLSDVTQAPPKAHLIIDGHHDVMLDQAIISIGRSRDNSIVLDDPYISRFHAQIRLRFGHYTIFDTASQSGILVNDVRVREHRLQPGDVIRMGNTSMVYLEDNPSLDTQTDSMDPV